MNVRNLAIAIVLKLILAVPVQGLASSSYQEKVETLAESGSAKAQYTLGLQYLDGAGVPKSSEKGFSWLMKAAKQGFPPAQFGVAHLYMAGIGVEESQEQYIQWMLTAAETGLLQAQTRVAKLYSLGVIEKNLAKEAYWYAKAAQQGDSYSMAHLGVMYYFGKGVTKDWRTALMLIGLARAQGEEDPIFTRYWLNTHAATLPEDSQRIARFIDSWEIGDPLPLPWP